MKTKVSTINEAERAKAMGATLQQAQDFLHSYSVLRAHNHACATTKQPPVFIVDVVNLAFAIELLLKALLNYTGKKAQGHKMNELFELLPVQTQEKIKKAFAEHLLRTTGNSRDIFGLTFEDRLKQYSDTYQYWRYFHEEGRGNFNSQFCENLAHVLNEIAQAQFNELHEVYVNSLIA